MIEKRTYGRVVRVELEVYTECKYTAAEQKKEEVFENAKTVRYENVESWDIVTGYEASLIEAENDCIDDYHEYLVLHFTNGEAVTFMNSYVDMWAR